VFRDQWRRCPCRHAQTAHLAPTSDFHFPRVAPLISALGIFRNEDDGIVGAVLALIAVRRWSL
jgi:hypothetical protein